MPFSMLGVLAHGDFDGSAACLDGIADQILSDLQQAILVSRYPNGFLGVNHPVNLRMTGSPWIDQVSRKGNQVRCPGFKLHRTKIILESIEYRLATLGPRAEPCQDILF
jgi:hypothetical protein